ncbi:MAG: AAA family ATPase [Pseudomonadota bacterium]
MDHLNYYSLKEEPFTVMPLTNFYYHNDQHDQAFLRLSRAVENMKGLAVLVGDVGTGKTLLARRLLEELPEEEYEVSLLVILHSDVDSDWLIKRIARQFGVENLAGTKVEVLQRLFDRLVQISEQGKRAVILIDEAQMLRKQELLEEIRGLLNLELPNQKLLSFVLFGMLELDETLKLEQALQHRLAVRCQLKNFSPEVVSDYIRFRLFHAGCDNQVFSPEALQKIHAYTKGNPRVINVVCDNALFEGFIRKAEIPIPSSVIEDVAADLGLSAAAEKPVIPQT